MAQIIGVLLEKNILVEKLLKTQILLKNYFKILDIISSATFEYPFELKCPNCPWG